MPILTKRHFAVLARGSPAKRCPNIQLKGDGGVFIVYAYRKNTVLNKDIWSYWLSLLLNWRLQLYAVARNGHGQPRSPEPGQVAYGALMTQRIGLGTIVGLYQARVATFGGRFSGATA